MPSFGKKKGCGTQTGEMTGSTSHNQKSEERKKTCDEVSYPMGDKDQEGKKTSKEEEVYSITSDNQE